MEANIKTVCTECKKNIVVLWEQVCGVRIVHELNGQHFYSAKCHKCNHEWEVKK